MKRELERMRAALDGGADYKAALEALLLELSDADAHRLMLLIRESRGAWATLLETGGGREAPRRPARVGAPRAARPPGAVAQAPAHQLIGPPATTVTERRFCDQQLSFEHSASGRSLP